MNKLGRKMHYEAFICFFDLGLSCADEQIIGLEGENENQYSRFFFLDCLLDCDCFVIRFFSNNYEKKLRHDCKGMKHVKQPLHLVGSSPLDKHFNPSFEDGNC